MGTYTTPAGDSTGEDGRRRSRDEELLDRVRRCRTLVSEADAPQRAREREDLLFQIAENQWSEEAKKERMGSNADGVAVPPRPMLSISLLQQPMQLVYNQFSKARLGVNLHPVSEDATEELAEIKQGLYRRIERDGQADQARGWAFMRALACGRGYYRVVTRYDEDGDNQFDQEIGFERILHQDSVYFDPAAQKPDLSDAKWCLIEHWMDWSDFKRQFPDSKAADDGSGGYDELAEDEPDWVRAASGDKEPAVLVCEYWYKEITRETVKYRGRKRHRDVTSVYLAWSTGAEVLEVEEWEGRYIPIIPVFGRELQPVDGDRRYEGMIRPARDGQMLYNFAASTLVERMAMEPKTPFIGAEGQFKGYEHEWAQANTRNLPYLQYKMIDLGGKPAPPPQRAQIDGSGMSLAMMALQEGKNFVQATTAVFEPSLGELPTRKDAQSGRAILALQQQTDAGTSGFMHSMASVTLRYEALVVLDLMPAIYDRAGRITRVLGMDDEPQTVMLNAPFTRDGRGFPRRAQTRQGPGVKVPGVKVFDLRKGKYEISVDIGKSHQTRLEAGQQFMAEVVQAAPALMGIVGDLLFKFRDEPGSKEISERLRRQIQATNPNVLDDGKGASAEQAQAQLQAMGQQLQQVQQQLGQAMQALETKQVEQAAKVQVEQIKAETQRAIAEGKNAADILVARIRAASAAMDHRAAAEEEAVATGIEVEAERERQAADHAHERGMAREERAHEAAMATAGGRSMKVSRSSGQDDEREESEETSDGQSRPAAPAMEVE